jgi:polysaccharide export outer membrane protein
MRKLFLVLGCIHITGCASEARAPVTLADFESSEAPRVYAIGAGDLLDVNVFQVPDISREKLRVDAAGHVQIPVLGPVVARGLTPEQLADAITTGLRDRYIRDPRVSVVVSEAASQKITVDGAVTKPGVYEMRGQVSLLQAVAMAEGPTGIANISEVVVFRNGERGRMAALFDLGAIRRGEAPDPVLEGDDIVVVDTSRLSVALRNAVALLPAFAPFAYL